MSRAYWLACSVNALGLVLSGCGGDSFDDGVDKASTRTADSKRNSGDGRGTTDGGDTDGTDGAGDGGDSGDGDGGGSDGSDGGDGTGNPDLGAELFNARVAPLFQAQCVSCHADPRVPVTTRGPLSIYSYNQMRALLADGPGSTDNALVDKVRNVATHGGGNRCAGGVTASPCKDIVAWWTAEFGAEDDEDGGGGSTNGAGGKISEVTSLGRAYGWAYETANTMAQLTVTFYVDGPKGTGIAAGTASANRSGADGNTPGDHAFIFDMPEAMRTGRARTLYAYVTIGGTDVLLGGAPTPFTAYTFSAAGRSYYEANVRGRLASCQGCHSVNYEQQFFSLIAPSPAEGGTAGNNQLINKPAQVNGASHGGGQRCASATASPCAEIQQWWRVEFGG